MNAERFEALAQAYGGDIGRWPVAERGAALDWAEAHIEARAVLADAAELDALLGAVTAPPPGLLLQQRVIASYPRRAPLQRARAWASGMALAAACAAGVLVGVNFSDRLLSDPAAETLSQTATVFDGASYIDVETTG